MFTRQANEIVEDINNHFLKSYPDMWSHIDIASVSMKYNTTSPLFNELLAKFNCLLNSHFKEMNNRSKFQRNEYLVPTYKAEPSRELLFIISMLEQLENGLNDEGIHIKALDSYDEHIAFCKSFLKSSGGSKIPANYSEIAIQQYKPIFDISESNSFDNIELLVFGAEKTKPDLVIKDVLERKIEIVNDSEFLVYSKVIEDSFLYRDFDIWWEERLKQFGHFDFSLEYLEEKVLNFYEDKYREDQNPVLIPQVYIHYDPKNQKQREAMASGKVLTFQRMDFLVLYGGKRIIIEIDGQSHTPEYSLKNYSKQCEYDRSMKFQGYDVFRLGGYELTHEFEKTVSLFFSNLYDYMEIERHNP